MKQGIRFIRKQGAMEGLIVLGFFMTALAIPMRTFLPVFADKVFHPGSETYAMFLSVSGMGSIVERWPWRPGQRAQQGADGPHHADVSGREHLGIRLFASLFLSCVALFFSGAVMMVVFTMVNSLVQLIVTNEMRGRVMSVYNFSFRGGMPVGNLIAGRLVPVFTAPVVLAVNGLLLVALGLYFFLVQRRVAEL